MRNNLLCWINLARTKKRYVLVKLNHGGSETKSVRVSFDEALQDAVAMDIQKFDIEEIMKEVG